VAAEVEAIGDRQQGDHVALRVTEDTLDLGVSSFEDLYRTYASRVRAVLRNRFRRDSARVDDLVQEVFLRAYRSRAALEPGRDPWPWLCTIALNLAIDEQRRPQREFAAEQLVLERSGESDPWEHYVASERGEALKAAMGQMSDRSRRLVLLKDAAGYDYEELAEVDGSTVQALRCAVLRARRRLRDSYSAELASRGLAAITAPFARFALPRFVSWQYRTRRTNEIGTMTTVAASSGFAAIVVGVASLLPAGASTAHPVTAARIASLSPSPAVANAFASPIDHDAALRNDAVSTAAAGAGQGPSATATNPLKPHATAHFGGTPSEPSYNVGAGLGSWLDATLDSKQGVKCSKSGEECAEVNTGARHTILPTPTP